MVVICLSSLVSETMGISNADQRKDTNVKYIVWQIAQGRYDQAIKLCRDQLEKQPDDLECFYGLAMAYGQKNDLDRAMMYVSKALEGGMPFERFLVGPRNLLEPLTGSEAFKEYAREHLAVELLHGPMLGAVTGNSARFWVRTLSEVPFKVRLSTSEQMKDARTSDTVKTSRANDFTGIVEVKGLKHNTPYYYEAVINGKVVPIQPRPCFRTYMEGGTKSSFKVGFGGGANYRPDNERMWDTVLSREPLAFLFLGDNTYYNIPDVPEHQQYFSYRRHSRPEYRRMIASTSMYAIYDDHDFGGNDSIGGPDIEKPAWKRNVVWRIFKENFINPYYGGGRKQPGVWCDFSIGDVDFFLLDCRYYRTDPQGRNPLYTDPQAKNPSMLGPVQKRWLLDKLKASKATFKVIAASVPWAFGTKTGSQNSASLGQRPGAEDTWEGFPQEREEIFKFIEDNRIEGVYLISADRHRSDAWKIERKNGYDFYEASTSHLTKDGSHPLMPKAIFSHRGRPMFGLLTFDMTKADPEIIYQVVDIDNKVVDTLVVKRSQLSFSTSASR